MQQVQLFCRPQTRKWTLETAQEQYYEIWVEDDATLCDILIAAYGEHQLPFGTNQTGIYEVQTDSGIYYSNVNRRLNPSTLRGMKQISFISWDKYEAQGAYQEEMLRQWSLETGLPKSKAPPNYPFKSKEEELSWFPTLDQIPYERKDLEKCEGLYTLKGEEWKAKFNPQALY
jgi:hypothetical protein